MSLCRVAYSSIPRIFCARSVAPVLSLPTLSPNILPSRRGYSSETPPPKRKKFVLPDEHTEEVFNALANNPPIMQALQKVIDALKQKGIPLDSEPTVSELWKIMKSKEIMQALDECILILYQV
jgi:hypothetical protein